MDTHRDTLREVVERMMPALGLLMEYLQEGVASTEADYREKGIDPASDTPTFCANVRQHVRQRMGRHLNLNAKAPMSPLHFDLGPYQLKVLHAANGRLPTPRTEARRRFYDKNAAGLFSMNFTPPDLVEIDEGIQEIEEGSLVLLWDAVGPDVTTVRLYRTSLIDWPGEQIDLLETTSVETAEDIEGIRKEEEREEGSETQTATGSGGGDGPRPTRSDGGEAEQIDEGQDEDG